MMSSFDLFRIFDTVMNFSFFQYAIDQKQTKTFKKDNKLILYQWIRAREMSLYSLVFIFQIYPIYYPSETIPLVVCIWGPW